MNKWEMVRLGDVCRIISGSTPKTGVPEYWDGDIKWITPAEIKSDSCYIQDTERHITELGKKSTGLQLMPKGTVLLSSRAPIGKVAIAVEEMCCNQGFKNLICSSQIHNKYLYYFLKKSTLFLNSLGNGATFKEISKKIVEKIEIPLPPLDEQRRIAESLDLASSLIEKRKRQIELLDLLAKSLFVEMFGDPVENPMGWEVDDLKNKAPAVSYKGKFKDNKLWLLNLDAIEANTGKVIFRNFVKMKDIGNSTCSFNTDNILYSKLRPYLNKVVIPDNTGYATSELIPLKPDVQSLNRIFLAYLLKSDNFVKYISKKVAGAKMPRVSMNDFWNFQIILPPIEIQKEFSDKITAIETQKSHLQNGLEKLEMNYKALMQKYFEDA